MTGKTTKKNGKPSRSSTSTKSGGKGGGKPKKTAAKTGRKRSSRKVFSKLWVMLMAAATGLTAITLVWALSLSPVDTLSTDIATIDKPVSAPAPTSSPQSVSRPAPTQPAKVASLKTPAPANHVRARIAPDAAPPPPSHRQGLVYEVFDTELLEQQVKEVDLALVQTIMELNLDPRSVRHLDIQMKTRNGQKYHTQSLAIGLDRDARSFEQTLRRNLELWVHNAELRQINGGPGKQELRISLLNLPTHTLFLEEHARKPLPPPSPAQPGTGPRLVVVIDDLGENVHQARELAALSFPVTFAVLPNISKSREVARIGAAAGRDVLLHQPMEPLDYPHRADPGPGALFVGMEDEQILRILRNNLAQVPQAIGINNHMGSRFTADESGMSTVLQELKRRDLFFLDSLTTGDSVADEQARKIGLEHLRRHIFLDNIPNVQAILFQLRKAEQLAHNQGQVIAIGHPYPETLEALKLWERERDQRINVVSLGSLLSRQSLAER
ncbi:divergent polysaccharide deacetylase family protein [Desulfonatronum thiodismutans]|uniref:divergent polysaccharide deacetylase family protein n=1 Tax=Desulfonatronum thiodismutans TaxID=159290 RepID=UPI00068F2059|nr:divergent polysaccharide deacetylase family protein [Desulfonatronum thiodismutans]